MCNLRYHNLNILWPSTKVGGMAFYIRFLRGITRLFLMKALSLRQPFAELILDGKKTIELRPWNTKFRGKFYIHAGKAAYKGFERYLGVDCAKVPRGAIVGTAELIDVKEYATDKDVERDVGKHCARGYCPGKKVYGFVLENVKRMKPIPYKGQLNFFEVEL